MNGAFERPLPHDEDAERATIGSVLLEQVVIADVSAVLAPYGAAAFFHEHNRLVFEVALDLFERGLPLDGIPFKNELVRRGVFDRIGGYEYLTRAASSVGSAMRATIYAKIVREKHERRLLISAAHAVMEAAFDDAVDRNALFTAADSGIAAVIDSSASARDAAPIGDCSITLSELYAELPPGSMTGLSTGFLELDEMTCGLQAAELTIFGARPSVGKTSLGLQIAFHIGRERPVLFLSLEMSRRKIEDRILIAQSGIWSKRFNARDWRHATDGENLRLAHERMKASRMILSDKSAMTIQEVGLLCRWAKRRYEIEAVFVDYLQLISGRPTKRSKTRAEEVGEVSRGLKEVAKSLSVPVVAMAQLNRQPEGRADARPNLADLRESGAIEQDADVVALLHRPGLKAVRENTGKDDGRAEIVIAKQRNGPIGVIELGYHGPTMRFTPNASGEPPPQDGATETAVPPQQDEQSTMPF